MTSAARAYIEELFEAFPSDCVPQGVVSQLAAEVAPQGAKAIAQTLGNKRWTEVSPLDAEAVAPYILTLTTEALSFYLPAFLRAAVTDLEGQAATYVLYAAVPLGQLEEFYRGTCCLFTAPQATLIANLLELMNSEASFEYFEEEIPQGIALWKRRALQG